MKRFALFILISIVFALAWGIYSYDAPGPLMAQKTVLLSHGEGVRGIAQTLENEGVVEHGWELMGAGIATGKARHFKAGEYEFPPNASLHEIVEMLAAGRVVVHKVTVPEGYSVREVLALLAKEPALTGDMPTNVAEGTLLPETYHFTHGDSRAELVRRMQKSMQENFTAMWEKRAENLPLPTQEAALTLASIVEKETGANDERARVAAVFENRLKLGMKLQSDPTAMYDLEQAANAPLGRALTTVDLTAPTPHNTYVIDGLPPTPICNPGHAALDAVLHPAASNELYFVATGHGGHHFAATLEEHNRNVAEYRAELKNLNNQ